ncbi:MAG: hypothetical protein OXI01_06980 [Albidovulum sp.]|nr:hypothetical protein [Albidovulum sp.]
MTSGVDGSRVLASGKENGMVDESTAKRGRGRPPKPIPKIYATPEQIARAIFSAIKPPDPLLRKFNLKRKAAAT